MEDPFPKLGMHAERDARVSFSMVFCYGDGPIYSVSFNGDDNALDRLKRTAAEAK